jgi:hypothetical protein
MNLDKDGSLAYSSLVFSIVSSLPSFVPCLAFVFVFVSVFVFVFVFVYDFDFVFVFLIVVLCRTRDNGG